MEFINNALAIYNKSGAQLMGAVGSATAFLQPTTDFFSDPRCYYDAPTQRWFYQEFVVGATTATQFEAVSNTQDPTGTYTVYSWDTTDASTAGCPCFGDYDQFGADANGIYIATDEFSISTACRTTGSSSTPSPRRCSRRPPPLASCRRSSPTA